MSGHDGGKQLVTCEYLFVRLSQACLYTSTSDDAFNLHTTHRHHIQTASDGTSWQQSSWQFIAISC
eukprot:2331232-Amphidinium_carterae.1